MRSRTLVLVSMCLLVACQDPTADREVVLEAGAPELARTVLEQNDGGIVSWASSPWGGEDSGVSWLPYTPRIKLTLEHGLGRVPASVLVYLSFDEDGRECALSAGDQARILAADSQWLVLSNNTNESYFARIVLD